MMGMESTSTRASGKIDIYLVFFIFFLKISNSLTQPIILDLYITLCQTCISFDYFSFHTLFPYLFPAFLQENHLLAKQHIQFVEHLKPTIALFQMPSKDETQEFHTNGRAVKRRFPQEYKWEDELF